MLSFFRRFTKSRYGLLVVFAFLGIILLAFGLGDITGLRNTGGNGMGGATVAKVGKVEITDREIRDRIDRFLRDLQAQGQTLTVADFIKANQLDALIDDLVNSTALEEFGRQSGMNVSKKLIDTDIANAPIFLDQVSGKFDKALFDRWLAEKRVSMATLYAEQYRARYAQWLVNRFTLGGQLPDGVVLPYASLALERRTGTVGFVQRNAMDAGPEPDDKVLTGFYTAHKNLYMVPERRIARYALVKPDSVGTPTAATDAEIADAYKKAGTRFAATEKRTVRQLVLPDQATANRVAGEVKGGKSIVDAAKQAGLEPANFDAVDKPALVKQSSQAIADAAFAAAQGGVVGPVRSPLGWAVLKVEKVENIAAKSLEQARAELAKEIGERKGVQALIDRRQAIDDGIGAGKTFAELVRDLKLTATSSPALARGGTDPLNPAAKPDAAIAPIAQAGFGMEAVGDEPVLVPIGQDGSFALVTLEKILPAAPRPFAELRDKVKADYLADYRLKGANKAADAIVALMRKGTPMAEAFRQAGVTQGVVLKPFTVQRAQAAQDKALQLAFSIPGKTPRKTAAPENSGFYIVYVDAIEAKSAASDPITLAGARSQLGQQVGPEYARQFIRAMRDQVKVTRNEAAIKKMRDDLARQGTGN